MIFERSAVSGAWSIEVERRADTRGFFARTYCEREFSQHGIPQKFVQANISYNAHRGTIRGLHFQWPPSREGKLVRCERGAVFDVIVDLRPESATFLRSFALELDAERANALYIPPGVAHGFQTLIDHTQVTYQMSDFYAPELSDGVRWNDPAFQVSWPLPVTTITERDRDYPDFNVDAHRERYLATLGCA